MGNYLLYSSPPSPTHTHTHTHTHTLTVWPEYMSEFLPQTLSLLCASFQMGGARGAFVSCKTQNF